MIAMRPFSWITRSNWKNNSGFTCYWSGFPSNTGRLRKPDATLQRPIP
jgi:hypothetical protein